MNALTPIILQRYEFETKEMEIIRMLSVISFKETKRYFENKKLNPVVSIPCLFQRQAESCQHIPD